MKRISPKGRKEESQKKSSPEDYSRLSGIGIQLAIIAGGSTYGGHLLDNFFSNNTPWYTIILSVTGICIGLYLFIRQIQK